jgi:hypothetical protein
MNGIAVRGPPDTVKMVMKNLQLKFIVISKWLAGAAVIATLAGCVVAPGGYYAGGYPYYGDYGYGPSYYSGGVVIGGFGHGYGYRGYYPGYYHGYHAYPGYHGYPAHGGYAWHDGGFSGHHMAPGAGAGGFGAHH